MREIKFRYRLKDLKTGEVFTIIFPLNDLEVSSIHASWQILGRYEFTGLHDKQGKDIYEGDIIEGKLKNPTVGTMGVIEYSVYWGAFGNSNDGGFTMLFKIMDIEIVGNIYENPELLKGD